METTDLRFPVHEFFKHELGELSPEVRIPTGLAAIKAQRDAVAETQRIHEQLELRSVEAKDNIHSLMNDSLARRNAKKAIKELETEARFVDSYLLAVEAELPEAFAQIGMLALGKVTQPTLA